MFDRIKRQWYKSRCQHPTMKEYLAASWPKPSAKIHELKFLALDLETTHLSASQGEIVSMGWVEIIECEIHLSTAKYFIIKPEKAMNQSAVFHELTDDKISQGITKEAAFSELLKTSSQHVFIFHHALMDLAFLNRLSKNIAGVPFNVPYIDTMLLEKNAFKKSNRPITSNALRLSQSRERYHLMDSDAQPHHALQDAIATGELFLAQCQNLSSKLNFNDLDPFSVF